LRVPSGGPPTPTQIRRSAPRRYARRPRSHSIRCAIRGSPAALARRAERFDPENPESFRLLTNSLRRTSRYRALERMLWRKLTSATPDGVVCRASLDELVALYQGPLGRPEIAAGLRRMYVGTQPRVAG